MGYHSINDLNWVIDKDTMHNKCSDCGKDFNYCSKE